jgi:hypothetical protein
VRPEKGALSLPDRSLALSEGSKAVRKRYLAFQVPL